MKKNQLSDNVDTSAEQEIDIKGIVLKYLSYWKWFVLSLFLAIVGAVLYIKSATPTYRVDASVLVKYESKNGAASAMGMDFASFGMFSSINNFYNEVELLQSRTLIRKVVTELDLYVSYAKFGLLRNNLLYKSSPIRVWMSPNEAEIMPSAAKFEIMVDADSIYHVELLMYDELGEKVEMKKSFESLPALFTTPYGTFSFSKGDFSFEDFEWKEDDKLIVYVASPTDVANSIKANLTAEQSSKTTTVVLVSLNTTNKQMGVDIVNKLVELYNRDANDEKNEVASKTAEFISERIQIINQELTATEQELENFKKDAKIVDVTVDGKMALEESSQYRKLSVNNNTQLRLIGFLNDYANDPKNIYQVLPVNVGLEDNGLSKIIAEYNEALMERNRLLITSSEDNPAVVNLEAIIVGLRQNVLTTIRSVEDGLKIAQADLDQQAIGFEGRIVDAPKFEREFVSISRQQEIKSELYILLLQKREENAITLASTADNARIFDDALPTKRPIAPSKKLILLIALFLGVALPVLIIYIRDLFRFKIEGRIDVEAITKVPIIGEIPATNSVPSDSSIVVSENKNDMMAESFRSLRTNVTYMLKEDEKVIIVTSTSSGEGKSFVSANLAISLALVGKKVVIVGLDIRKPGLNKAFGISTKADGISRYLSNPSIDLSSLVHKSPVSNNLDILLGGAIPPNPTELVSRPSLKQAIEILKEKYDYVVIDSAPIGMVTDTQIIAKVADLSIYVCRADFTHKSDYSFINDIADNNKLPCITTLINGIDINRKRYGYGYGKKYGYGYGYGYGFESEN